MTTNRRIRRNQPLSATIGCAIRVSTDGTITVYRDPGCAPNDVRQLCEAVTSGKLEIMDLTERTAESD